TGMLLRVAHERATGDRPPAVRLDRATLLVEAHARRQLATRNDVVGAAIGRSSARWRARPAGEQALTSGRDGRWTRVVSPPSQLTLVDTHDTRADRAAVHEMLALDDGHGVRTIPVAIAEVAVAPAVCIVDVGVVDDDRVRDVHPMNVTPRVPV